MGDKSTAKSTMQKVGVPTVPGSEGLLESVSDASQLAAEMGYPVMIKATAGGGGRGMRLVGNADELDNLLRLHRGKQKLRNPGLYGEIYRSPKACRGSILADRFGNVVHLGERLLDSKTASETIRGITKPFLMIT